ncbi:MAG TPA: hypothetical protein P5081_01315 [Phycisphaerae bacterium]|nr:hypothetical protein [Phycisphaerae bacterium]HRW51493.1 hypothetical protein [Phycisphaerae bacterium]
MSKQSREMLTIGLFVLVCGWVIVGISFDLFGKIEYAINFNSMAAPLGAVTGLGVVIVLALVRFVILMRHRVPHGHCPHCGGRIDGTPDRCGACSGVIRRSSDAHEKRTHGRGLFRLLATAGAWLFLILWALSFNLGAEIETKRYFAGDGYSLELRTADLRTSARAAFIDDGSAAPTGMVRDMVAIGRVRNDQISWKRKAAGRTYYWWPSRFDTGRFHTPTDLVRPFNKETYRYDRIRISPEQEEALLARYNVGYGEYSYTEHGLIVPLWLPTVLLFGVVMLMRFRNRAYPPGCCQHCGYDLDRVAGHACPECGTPKVESTYGIPTRWRRRTQDPSEPAS